MMANKKLQTKLCESFTAISHPFPPRFRSMATLLAFISLCSVMNTAEAKLKAVSSSEKSLEIQARKKESEHNYAAAIAIYDRLLTIHPDHRNAKRGRIMSLLRLGAPHQALRLAGQNTGLFSPDEWQQMFGDQSAKEIRWGRLPSVDPAERYNDTDSAIQLLKKQYLKITDEASDAALRNRFDLMAAYHNRRYAHKSIKIYKQLQEKGVKSFPPYVQAIVGDAYLAMREPEKAITLLKQSLDQYPENLDAQYSLFYAYLEAGHYKKSLDHIDTFAASLPEWIWPPGSKERQLNIDRLYAQATAIMARAYVGNLGVAESELQSFAKQSPPNTDIQSSLASIHLWRGWPHRALQEYRTVLTHDPDNLDAHKGIVSALTARGDIHGSDAALKPLQTVYGDDPHVKNLVRESTIRKMREIWVEINGGSGTGTKFDRGNKDLGFAAYYYDSPLNPGLRPFAYFSRNQADFTGETVQRNRLAAGLHYQQQDIVLRGNLSAGTGSPGISLQGDWSPTDHWQGSFSMESFSEQTPLRADLGGIEAWSLGASTKYRFHESRSLGLSLQYMGFDDGNRRKTLSALGQQRLITGLRYKLDGELSLYHQTNTANEAIYFNPSTQSAIGLNLNSEWLTYRHYEKSMRQRLLINIGSSSQQDFNTEPTWTVSYEHHWSFSQQLSLGYGINRSRPVYDGIREFFTRGFMNLYIRF